MEIEEELLSLPEVARELGISHVQVWRLVRANKLAVVRIGPAGRRSTLGVRRETLEAFRQQKRPKGRPPKPSS